MTSTPVVNGKDMQIPTCTDNMQTQKNANPFAGSFKRAVEDGKLEKSEDRQNTVREKDDKKDTAQVASERMKSSRDTKAVAAGQKEKEKGNATDIADTVSKIRDILQESLHLTKEQLEDAMEQLGLSGLDLLQPENITALVVEVTGIEDSLALITNASLYEDWQSLKEQVGALTEELAQNLGVEPKELKEFAETMEEAEKAQSDILQALPKEEKEELNSAELTEAYPEQKEKTEPVKPAVSGTENNAAEENPEKRGKTEKALKNTEKQSKNPETWTPANPVNGELPRPFTGNKTISPEETTQRSYFTGDTQDIAGQILDHMKIQVKEGVSELEMQLHPASLGNVHVLLVAKEGNITAQFTAQTEAVKEALESQLVQLKEQFEEQGIKVDAVEVAVSNHQFEKQYQGDEQRDSQRNEKNRVRTRRMNLEELREDELDLLLTDEEKLQADLMKKTGNTVDFTA